MKILDLILDELEAQGKRKTPRAMYANALFFNLSVLLNVTSGRVQKEDGSGINYYGITLAGSSLGKSWSFNVIKNMFIPIKDETYANS